MFAVAAYDKEGELIGNSVGESTDPILVSNTYSILICWSLLCQVCYQIGNYDLSITSCEKLSKYFVIQPNESEPEKKIVRNEPTFTIKFYQ